MNNSVQDCIRRRKSVRTFNGAELRGEDRQKLEQYLETLDNPFGVPVEFRFLDAKEHELSSPVIIGTDLYIAEKVSRVPQSEIAYGYCFEKFCLYAEAIGIGTVILAATISRKTFEKAMEVRDTEVMYAASPVGYPAEKRSDLENTMRVRLKSDERLLFEELFFEGSFARSLMPEHAGQFQDALKMMRLAPSARNKQPWRGVVCGDRVYFYEKKTESMSKNPLGDIQKVDVGIALANFDLTMKEAGRDGRFMAENPGFEINDCMEYIITYEVTH